MRWRAWVVLLGYLFWTVPLFGEDEEKPVRDPAPRLRPLQLDLRLVDSARVVEVHQARGAGSLLPWEPPPSRKGVTAQPEPLRPLGIPLPEILWADPELLADPTALKQEAIQQLQEKEGLR